MFGVTRGNPESVSIGKYENDPLVRTNLALNLKEEP